MSGDHGAAHGLRHVSDEEPRPAVGFCVLRQPLDVSDEHGMSPVAIAGQAHDLPGGAIDGERFRPSDAAFRIAADGARSAWRRQLLRAEDVLGDWRGGRGLS